MLDAEFDPTESVGTSQRKRSQAQAKKLTYLGGGRNSSTSRRSKASLRGDTLQPRELESLTLTTGRSSTRRPNRIRVIPSNI